MGGIISLSLLELAPQSSCSCLAFLISSPRPIEPHVPVIKHRCQCGDWHMHSPLTSPSMKRHPVKLTLGDAPL